LWLLPSLPSPSHQKLNPRFWFWAEARTLQCSGGHGILAGLANIAPKACIETIRLYREGRIAEAQNMQEIVARGDWAAIQGGIVSTKAGMESWLGYGGYARSPLPRPTSAESSKWKEGFRELIKLEKSL
jgi:4-hydroxy-2-oxoglutarate aldolase